MAVSDPRPDPPFAGDFQQLVKGSLQLGDFVCPYMLPCKRGRKLYLCSLGDFVFSIILFGAKQLWLESVLLWLEKVISLQAIKMYHNGAVINVTEVKQYHIGTAVRVFGGEAVPR